LNQRATEMVLLDEAHSREITVSDADLEDGLHSIMADLGFSEFNHQNLSRLGIVDEKRFKTYVYDRMLINELISQIKNDMEGDDIERRIQLLIPDLYQNSGIQTFPENLRSPLSRRYE
ncbi:MAG: hypothetical protein HKN08_06915, partial [Gammaproteobacteria bacterium]|nr:hypothetical protein [Gammaproteobacteria bacterium]